MKLVVEANGGSVIFGFWDEEHQLFTLNKKLPRKLKKKLNKDYYKFHKDTLKHVTNFHISKDWKDSFSLKIAKEKLDDKYHIYFSSYLSENNEVSNRDLIYRKENSNLIEYNDVLHSSRKCF